MLQEKPRVEFEEDAFLTGRMKSMQGKVASSLEVKGFAGWLIRNNIAKTEKTAQFIMMGIAALNILLTILVIKLLS